MLSPVWILPRRCTSNVRSVISTTSAAFTDWTAEITSPRCSTLPHSTVISRTVRSPLASTVSTATIEPPARVMAAVTLPSTPPGRDGSATRSVSENCAEGVATEADHTGGLLSLGRTTALRGLARDRPAGGAFCFHLATESAPAPGAVVRGEPPPSVGLICGARVAEGAAPYRWEQPRLSGFFRAARVDRDVEGAAHERDLRLRIHAGEDHLRVRSQAHAGRLGRRDVRARGCVRRVQGSAPVAAGPACRAVAAHAAARRCLRLRERPR